MTRMRMALQPSGVEESCSARVRRWSLYLSMFEYTLKFRGTKEHANADALSRLPLPVEPASVKTPPELVLLTDHLSLSQPLMHFSVRLLQTPQRCN